MKSNLSSFCESFKNKEFSYFIIKELKPPHGYMQTREYNQFSVVKVIVDISSNIIKEENIITFSSLEELKKESDLLGINPIRDINWNEFLQYVKGLLYRKEYEIILLKQQALFLNNCFQQINYVNTEIQKILTVEPTIENISYCEEVLNYHPEMKIERLNYLQMETQKRIKIEEEALQFYKDFFKDISTSQIIQIQEDKKSEIESLNNKTTITTIDNEYPISEETIDVKGLDFSPEKLQEQSYKTKEKRGPVKFKKIKEIITKCGGHYLEDDKLLRFTKASSKVDYSWNDSAYYTRDIGGQNFHHIIVPYECELDDMVFAVKIAEELQDVLKLEIVLPEFLFICDGVPAEGTVPVSGKSIKNTMYQSKKIDYELLYSLINNIKNKT